VPFKAARLAPLILLAAVACERQDRENASDQSGKAPAQAAAPAAPSAPVQTAMSREAIEAAAFTAEAAVSQEATPVFLRAQILLDRTKFSPGVIDGRPGENTRQAIAAFEAESNLPVDGQLDEAVFQRLTQIDARPVLTEYQISQQDVAGPFVETIPEKYEDMAKLKTLAYSSPLELLAEKFHMTPEMLQQLNPNVDFTRAGQTITVAALGNDQLQGDIAEIVVDKGERAVRVMGAGGQLLAFYPATIGSDVLPSPEGAMKVRAVAPEPTYTFDPKRLNWEGAKSKVTVAAGPNNPVGSVWIDLSKDTYGIHGTPEPRYVGKRPSHGCVRLTNWDAEELASRIKPGVSVRFVEGGGAAAAGKAGATPATGKAGGAGSQST
jgi:lipoprotein-anchoring transpeptidase ErfK/SrfK